MKKLLLFVVFFYVSSLSLAQTINLTVSNGFGGGNYATGDSAFVLANPTPQNFIFERWSTNAPLSDTFCMATIVKNMRSNTVLTPVYSSAPNWTNTAEKINGSNVYAYFPTTPANLKGLILFFHGSNGNGGSWFNKIENRMFLNYAVAKGYAALSTESTDRITGGTQPWQWSNSTTFATNPDIQNIDKILDTFRMRGKITTTTKLFGVGFSQGSGFTSIISALKNYAANSLGATPGITGVIAQTLSPTYFMSSRLDLNADPDRLSKCITNYNTLVSRRIDAELRIHEPFPVTPNRFWRIPTVDSVASLDMFNRLKNNNYLDSRRFVNFNPDANTAWKSVMQPTYNAVLDDIEDQVIICYTEHKFHSDQMYYIIKFFDRYANRINTGVANDIQKEEIIVYPNPFYNRINIKNAKGNENFILTNALGQTIYFGKNVSERDFSHLDNGIYFITITDFGKKTPPQYFKLLKQ